MSGGSGCRQIKVFVFRPGFHCAVTALGFRFPFLSPCVFPFISLFPRSVPFFLRFLCLFPFLCSHPTTCTASVELLFSASPALPCPSSLLLLHSGWTCSGSHEACLSTVPTAWMRGCVCVFMMMLLSANEARVCFRAACGVSLSVMRLVSADEAFVSVSLRTFAHYLRTDNCSALETEMQRCWKWQHDIKTWTV